MIPKTFDQWRTCIVKDCKINLDQDFAKKRLAVYQDNTNRETQKFVSLYGEQHLQNVISWLQQV